MTGPLSALTRGVVSLVGYRGCGKTTLAPRLAGALGWDWLDADVELERRAGRTIREIFSTEGESGFRTRERDLLAELLQRDRLVLASGGGAILNEHTRADMRRAGPVVWLRASAEELYARISGDTTTAARRPNLAGGGLNEVVELLSRREPLYREVATIIVDAVQKSPETILAEVFAALSAHEAAS
jgi:shikimate kinase